MRLVVKAGDFPSSPLITRILLTEFQGMVDAVGGPNTIRPSDPNNPYPGLTNFSLITHGFGNPALSTAISQVQMYLSELLAIYEGRTAVRPESKCPGGTYRDSNPYSHHGGGRGYMFGEQVAMSSASAAALQCGLGGTLKQEPREGPNF